MKLMVIGLDGATWKVIDPLLAEGRLPHLARLIQEGTRAKLRSFQYMLSPILWTDIATGKLPEKHGVTRYFHTANNVRTKRLWDIVGGQDKTVALWSWPVTWPPRPVNGFVVPSLFARSPDTYPADLRFVKEMETGMDKGWPARVQIITRALRHGLRPATAARIAHYYIAEKLGKYEWRDRHMQQRLLKLDIHLDLYTRLVQEYRPYLATFYLNVTDAFGHVFWRYYEPRLFPEVKPEDVAKYGGAIPLAYEKADQAVGRLCALADEDTLIVVMSDHGFQAELEDGPKFQSRVLADHLIKALDMRVPYVNYRHWVVFEVSGSRPDVIEKLSQLRVKELDRPLLRVDEDADGRITVHLYIQGGIYEQMTMADLEGLHVVWPGGERPFLYFIDPHYNRRQSGVHHLDGMGIFHGPGVQPGGKVEGTIVDMVPTVLALLGMPVARDMDGRVLVDMITPAHLAKVPLTHIDTYDTDLVLSEELDEEEIPQDLEERLRALGYIG